MLVISSELVCSFKVCNRKAAPKAKCVIKKVVAKVKSCKGRRSRSNSPVPPTVPPKNPDEIDPSDQV